MRPLNRPMGLGALVLDGIGDTIRVSVTGDPVLEVDRNCEKNTIALLRRKKRRCGDYILSDMRAVHAWISKNWPDRSCGIYRKHLKKPMKIAVMGCAVNGPGERQRRPTQDVAGGGGRGVLFSRGAVLKTVPEERSF